MDADEPRKSDSVGTEILQTFSGADTRLWTLVLDVRSYARQVRRICVGPRAFFTTLAHDEPGALRPSISFLVQGATLGFLLFTMSTVLPESLARFWAVQGVLLWGTQQENVSYAVRVQRIDAALPDDLSREWRARGELMLLTRALPDARFELLLDRLAALQSESPELLGIAISGSATVARSAGREYLLMLMLVLDPQRGPLLKSVHQIVGAGPRYEFSAHVGFLLRTALLWYIGCAVLFWCLGRSSTRWTDLLRIGAYVTGTWVPLVEVLRLVAYLYDAATLAPFARFASELLATPGTVLDLWPHGPWPYETLLLSVVRTLGAVAVAVAGAGMLVTGLRTTFGTSAPLAWVAAIGAGAIGVSAGELAANLLALILVPAGIG